MPIIFWGVVIILGLCLVPGFVWFLILAPIAFIAPLVYESMREDDFWKYRVGVKYDPEKDEYVDIYRYKIWDYLPDFKKIFKRKSKKDDDII